jgi:hypothetical protein
MSNLRIFVASLVFALAAVSQGLVYAGTTGSLSGTVDDAFGHAIQNARVAVVSPSQRETTTSDARGAFSFASLAPDRYDVSVEREGYEPLVLRDVRVTADQTRTLTAVVTRVFLRIGRVSATSSGLVRPGTTQSVYSVAPAIAEAAEAIGAGANLQNAYSAISTVPGVYLPFGQQGAEQNIYIRGGDATEVGYEYDGVPVNRAFDNTPAHTTANLGQQELQVYTSGGDYGASSSGTAGFINQVIRTGTYPGFADAKLGFGSPTFYHGLTVEAGGATPDHRFSYYAGLGGYNQDYRFFDQFNGASQEIFQPGVAFFATDDLTNHQGVYPTCVGNPPLTDPFGGKPPARGVQHGTGCWTTLPTPFLLTSNIADREAVVNLHVGIPHHRDSGMDDVQLLYSSSFQLLQPYSSVNDAGAQFVSGIIGGPAVWPDAVTWPAGTKFGQPATGLTAVPYFDPSSPPHAVGAPLPPDHRDSINFNDGIVKLQYQKNIGSSAYARLFVYSFYSDFAENGALGYAPGGEIFSNYDYDYDLNSHTRGAELKTAFAFGSKHFFNATFNAVTAATTRFNNDTYMNEPDSQATNLTDGTHCYAYADGNVSGVAYAAGDVAPCNSPLTSGTFADPTRGNAKALGAAAAAGAIWQVTYAGERGFLNTVQPRFTSASVSDLYRPSERVTIEGALRFDRFDYRLADTSGDGRAFWFAAGQNEFCYNPVTGAPVLGEVVPPPLSFVESTDPFIGTKCPVDSTSGKAIQTVHPDGRNGHLLLSNSFDRDEAYTVIEPRIGMTYSVNPDTVLRASYGRYAQGPVSAYVQYDAKEANLAFPLFQAFWPYGFTTPRHESAPLLSDDFDLSYERHFRGTDASLKMTPYYRTASNQYYGVYSAFLATGLNSGSQQNIGLEAEFTKGDFKRQGLSLLLSYAYLNSRERFADYPGTTQNPLDPFNQAIVAYDALTKAGGGAPCYANSGDATPDPACRSTSIRNPYYSRSPQPQFRDGAWYPTGLDSPYLSPHTFTAVANYRRGAFTVTPSLQVTAGPEYGNPLDVSGLDPRSCTNNSAGMLGSRISKTDPLQADYTSCGISQTASGVLAIPNPETGTFDDFGQFRQPWHLGLNVALGYDVSARMHATLTLANLYEGCFGGSRTPWSAARPPGSTVCSYQANGFYVSNFYNGISPNDLGANAVPLNPHFAQPFKPSYSDPNIANFAVPFNAYLQLSVRI